MMSFERAEFWPAQAPLTTKQPVFSGRLDFRVVAADNIYNVFK